MGVHLVVGGGSGIGAALASTLRARGDTAVVWDVAGECDLTCDISSEAAVASAMDSTVQTWGVPDLVSISAGIAHSAPLLDVRASAWDTVMATNARGPMLVLQACAARLKAAGVGGSMVVVTSVSAELVDRGMSAYCASKAAAEMLVKVAAAEWGELGIRVNAVAPGATRTPMLRAPESSPWLIAVAERTALRRLGSAQDVADAVLAVHDLGWVTGQVIVADGGLSLHSPIDAWSARNG